MAMGLITWLIWYLWDRDGMSLRRLFKTTITPAVIILMSLLDAI